MPVSDRRGSTDSGQRRQCNSAPCFGRGRSRLAYREYLLGARWLAALFKFLADADVSWTEALAGGVVTALIVTLGNLIATEYLKRWGSASLGGAAGSLLVGLIWIFAIAQIILAGAELTRTLQFKGPPALRHRRGDAATPD